MALIMLIIGTLLIFCGFAVDSNDKIIVGFLFIIMHRTYVIEEKIDKDS